MNDDWDEVTLVEVPVPTDDTPRDPRSYRGERLPWIGSGARGSQDVLSTGDLDSVRQEVEAGTRGLEVLEGCLDSLAIDHDG
jgi:hypothetical protein